MLPSPPPPKSSSHALFSILPRVSSGGGTGGCRCCSGYSSPPPAVAVPRGIYVCGRRRDPLKCRNQSHPATIALHTSSQCTSSIRPCPLCLTKPKLCIWPKTCTARACCLVRYDVTLSACPTSPAMIAPRSAGRSMSG